MSGRLMCPFGMRSHCYSSHLHDQTTRDEFGGRVTSAESRGICADKEWCLTVQLWILNSMGHISLVWPLLGWQIEAFCGLLGFTLSGLFVSFFSLTQANFVKLFLNPSQTSEGRDSLSQLVFYGSVLYTDLMEGVLGWTLMFYHSKYQSCVHSKHEPQAALSTAETVQMHP